MPPSVLLSGVPRGHAAADGRGAGGVRQGPPPERGGPAAQRGQRHPHQPLRGGRAAPPGPHAVPPRSVVQRPPDRDLAGAAVAGARPRVSRRGGGDLVDDADQLFRGEEDGYLPEEADGGEGRAGRRQSGGGVEHAHPQNAGMGGSVRGADRLAAHHRTHGAPLLRAVPGGVYGALLGRAHAGGGHQLRRVRGHGGDPGGGVGARVSGPVRHSAVPAASVDERDEQRHGGGRGGGAGPGVSGGGGTDARGAGGQQKQCRVDRRRHVSARWGADAGAGRGVGARRGRHAGSRRARGDGARGDRPGGHGAERGAVGDCGAEGADGGLRAGDADAPRAGVRRRRGGGGPGAGARAVRLEFESAVPAAGRFRGAERGVGGGRGGRGVGEVDADRRHPGRGRAPLGQRPRQRHPGLRGPDPLHHERHGPPQRHLWRPLPLRISLPPRRGRVRPPPRPGPPPGGRRLRDRRARRDPLGGTGGPRLPGARVLRRGRPVPPGRPAGGRGRARGPAPVRAVYRGDAAGRDRATVERGAGDQRAAVSGAPPSESDRGAGGGGGGGERHAQGAHGGSE
mmetsp:Transcript_49166/g.96096  ORF Transcript_49166/g.96096 Transcript_49166/m.96096 type:complete len:567 (-) Transcript_49166:464-2164(-)